MKKDIYDKSIETRELQLVGFGVNSSHYGLVGFLMIIPVFVLVFHLIAYFQNNPASIKDGELSMVIIPLVLAVIVYLIQKRRLKFRIVQTELSGVQLKEILIKVAKELDWAFIASSKDVYVAKTNPGFFSGSWGEQITILFYQNYVFVNSICDPEKRASVVSWGRNRKNEETLIDNIKQKDHQSEILSQ